MRFRIVTFLLIFCMISASLSYADSQGLDWSNTESPSPSSSSSPLFHFSDVEFRISGTSNVRDWDIVSDTLGGIIRLGPAYTQPDENSGNPAQWIEEVYLYIPNHSLESGIRMMNQTMNQSLESETYAKLEYRMTNIVDMLADSGSEEQGFIVNGVVGAAGSEYELEHEVYVRQLSGETFRIFGDFEMNMTDLGIEPPTFMRGALTTTDAVRVDYNFTVTFED